MLLYLVSKSLVSKVEGRELTSRASSEPLPSEELQDPTLVVSPVRAETASVAEQSYQSLREAILAMDIYRPDADLRLDEQRLASALGVSRTPVRQALARLQHEGLVLVMPR